MTYNKKIQYIFKHGGLIGLESSDKRVVTATQIAEALVKLLPKWAIKRNVDRQTVNTWRKKDITPNRKYLLKDQLTCTRK